MRRLLFLGVLHCTLFFIPAISLAEGTTAEMMQMIENWKDRASHGSITAPFQLGFCYQHGRGVKKNLSEAAKWYSLGAERGDLQAALELAGMYSKGEGVQKSENNAISWYVKIGKSNSIYAPIARLNLLALAKKYSLGDQDTVPDKGKARVLFEKLFEIETALMEQGRTQLNKQ